LLVACSPWSAAHWLDVGRFMLSSCMKLHLAETANRRTAEYRTAEFRRVVSFDIPYSIFDIRFPKVSFSIKPAAPAASG
jgi:hypothetical protein